MRHFTGNDKTGWFYGMAGEAGARKTHKDTDNFLVTVKSINTQP
jgi:hypothetical protein